MAEYEDAVRAGHISFEQAEGIKGRSGKAPMSGPRTSEVLIYFGAAAFAVATLVLAFDIALGDLDVFAILTGSFDNVPAGLVALAGAAILLALGYRWSDSKEGAVHRAAGFTLLAAFGLVSAAVGLLLYDLDLGDFTPLVRLVPVAIVALFIWQRAPSTPTHLALFLTAIEAVTALLILFQIEDPIEPASIAASAALGGSTPDLQGWISLLVLTAFGAAWVWLGITGRAKPRNTAFVLGGSYAWFNSIQLFGTADGWVILSLAVAAAFIWGATQWQSSVLAAIGTVATLILVTQLIAVFVDSPTPTTFVVAYGVPAVLALGAAWMFNSDSAPKAEATPAEAEPEA